VTWAAGIDVDQQFYNFGASGSIVFTLLSGILLIRLLSIPASNRAVSQPSGAVVR
jgi:NAD kinase